MCLEGLTSDTELQKNKSEFKKWLESEFEHSKTYKSDLNGLMEFGHDLNQV